MYAGNLLSSAIQDLNCSELQDRRCDQVQPISRELFRDESSVRLGGRAPDVLHALGAAKGDVVSKTELLAQVWPGMVVGENNLQVQISLLRKTLQEDTSGDSYLVTVPGRGYRLVGDSRRSHAADIVAKLFCGADR